MTSDLVANMNRDGRPVSTRDDAIGENGLKQALFGRIIPIDKSSVRCHCGIV